MPACCRRSGLNWVSRLHLLMGIGSYVTSPLWLCFLLAGVLISLQSRFVKPQYFGSTKSLFPRWPQVDPVLAKWVFIATMAVLLAPKVMAYILLLFDGPLRRGCGGAVRALLSLLLETLLGGFVAPVAMLIQTEGVMQILFGRDSGWNVQQREGASVPLRLVWRQYRRFMAFGLVLAAAAYAVSPALFLWMTPVLAGLVLAVPLVVMTGSQGIGSGLRRLGAAPHHRGAHALGRHGPGCTMAGRLRDRRRRRRRRSRRLLHDADLGACCGRHDGDAAAPARRPGRDSHRRAAAGRPHQAARRPRRWTARPVLRDQLSRGEAHEIRDLRRAVLELGGRTARRLSALQDLRR